MDFITTRVKELLSSISPIKRWFISNIAEEYYRKGYLDGQKLVYKNVLKGNALKDFIELLNYCGIKLSYNLSKGGLIISVRSDKIPNLQNLMCVYEKEKESKPFNGSV